MPPEELICPRCGQRNDVDANFCPVCGASLIVPEGTDGEPTALHEAIAVDDDVPVAVVTRGANAGSRYALGDVTTIGRHPESSIFLDDVTVSRRHAEIRRVDDRFELRDVGSLNGTYLDGSRVESAMLADGAQVQVGRFRLVVLTGSSDVDG